MHAFADSISFGDGSFSRTRRRETVRSNNLAASQKVRSNLDNITRDVDPVRLIGPVPRWVGVIHRIIVDIRIEVEVILVPDGIGLEEGPVDGIVGAGLVVIELGLGQLDLAGVGVARAAPGGGRAVGVIDVGLPQRPGR
jgi:hypothetical protein